MAKFETEVWGRLRDVERTICEDFDSAKSSPHQEPPAPSVTVAHLIQFVEYLESLRYMFANMIATIDSCLPGTRMAMFLPTVTHPPPATAGDERAQLARLIDGLVEVSRDRLFEDGGALVTTAAWREVARYADGWVNEWMCWGRVGGGWEPVEVESGGGGEGGESWRGGGGDCQVKLKPEYEVPAFLKPCQMIVVMTGEMIRVVERFEQMREIDVHKDAGGGTASAGHTEGKQAPHTHMCERKGPRIKGGAVCLCGGGYNMHLERVLEPHLNTGGGRMSVMRACVARSCFARRELLSRVWSCVLCSFVAALRQAPKL